MLGVEDKNVKKQGLNIVMPPCPPFVDHLAQAKFLIIHKNSALCDLHRISFIHQPPLAKLVMLLTFQSNLSSSWPQECVELFQNLINVLQHPHKIIIFGKKSSTYWGQVEPSIGLKKQSHLLLCLRRLMNEVNVMGTTL